ncbi:hypothetical protein PUNSTDRAFT_133811 [Punctularia strigosozonata HHB-11173 SS5]|uniref:uncharacterized protein n=1 Tax=Punctularia strigosozonata (strain HHB-11173) TaxID=741275 RepID=UPI000441641C|nr:uncharacterized protein PUNSTDRAFT_133811 [Punctularia strigosozonata HHB-11173 SS5]EIN10044.1 hypothetical protein PUNSTDRAFT_133811 [Punctularia strigosozonata HHB-11173 SS5]
MFESKASFAQALESGQILHHDAICLEENDFHLVKAPDDKKAVAYILWKKDSNADTAPCEDKVFGYVVYNFDQLLNVVLQDNIVQALKDSNVRIQL